MTLRLEVRQQHHTCDFRLSWGEGQHLPPATLPYPKALSEAYQQWQQAYLNFYRSFRGRVADVGNFSDVEDWRSQLVTAEADLLTEFHEWLRHKKLDSIRRQIAQLAKELSVQASLKEDFDISLTIFLTCDPIELERLPWEAWEIGKELGTTTTIRIARAPDMIRATPIKEARQGRNRVLIILGDDTGLDFKSDREAVQGLSHVADIHFVGWQPKQNIADLFNQITTAITDKRGWDLLLFAGHSNETKITGGELAIAPGISISVSELIPCLTIAKQRGLQFALFNSCSGLSIANSLIDLGFNQVAVMREPVHNKVAQEFLVQFLRNMAQYKDVHEALIAASQFLKLEKNLTYPSSALIPSLFCRPGQQLFCFRRFGWKEWIRPLLPTRKQAIALAGVACLSVLLPVQGVLLEQRLWSQALYRRVTGQLTGQQSDVISNSITLVQIDEESLQKAGITEPNPMDRTYLAQIIDQLSQLDAQVVGVDYLLDRPAQQETDDQAIADAMQQSASQGTWFVLASKLNANGEWSTLLPGVNFPSDMPNWSLQGNINLLGHRRDHNLLPAYMSLVYPGIAESENRLPFSYLLALAAQANAESDSLQPTLQSQSPLLTQLLEYLGQREQNLTTLFSSRSHLQDITILSYWLKQIWLHPIIDFSIPPNQVYQSIPAWQVLDDSSAAKLDFQNQIVVIAAGGYEEAGLLPEQDNKVLPAAVRHWRFWQENRSAPLDIITGGEVHAYMLHHFLTQRLVVPIPDLWMIGVAALCGKITVLALQNRSIHRRQGMVLLAGATAAYGALSLQAYVSAAILFPWLLPSVIFWIYAFPVLGTLNDHNEKSYVAFA